jgi:hypothetical protein
VGRPGLTARRYLYPVLATFVRALPYSFREVRAPTGTTVRVVVTGAAGASWILSRQGSGWSLRADNGEPAAATVELDQDSAWRLFTKGLAPGEAKGRAVTQGDPNLAEKVFDTVSIIA